MNHQMVQLDLPEELYERVRQIAENSQRPLETVLIESLALMFGDLPDEALPVEQFDSLADAQLWAVVYRQFAPDKDNRLHELTAMGKNRALSTNEQAELESLISQYDRYVLLRSKALLVLKQRGYDVERRLRLGA